MICFLLKIFRIGGFEFGVHNATRLPNITPNLPDPFFFNEHSQLAYDDIRLETANISEDNVRVGSDDKLLSLFI